MGKGDRSLSLGRGFTGAGRWLGGGSARRVWFALASASEMVGAEEVDLFGVRMIWGAQMWSWFA